jgi:hypothetical protein
MRRSNALLIAGLMLAATPALAAPPGFAFLEVPAGARASALGGAYASLATGVEGALWNPAALPSAKGLEITGGHAELLEKLRQDYFAIAGRMFGGGISGSIRALYSDPIEERDDLGNLLGSFGAHDLEMALGYGHELTGGVSIGGSAAVVRERISNLSAMTYSVGAGAAWDSPSLPGLRVALAAQNLGPAAHYTIDGIQGQPVGLPAAVQTGVSYSTAIGTNYRLTGALESRATRGRNALGLAGAEVADPHGASLRLGMRVNDTASFASFGAGYALPSFTLDYAFVPLKDDLGDTHRFAFRTRF